MKIVNDRLHTMCMHLPYMIDLVHFKKKNYNLYIQMYRTTNENIYRNRQKQSNKQNKEETRN